MMPLMTGCIGQIRTRYGTRPCGRKIKSGQHCGTHLRSKKIQDAKLAEVERRIEQRARVIAVIQAARFAAVVNDSRIDSLRAALHILDKTPLP